MRCALASQGGSNLIRIFAAGLLKLAAVLLFLLLPVLSQAQGIAFDAASSANTGTGTAASLTWSHTVGSSGTNSILIVGVSIRNSSSQTPALALGSYFSATGNTTTPTVNVTSVPQGALVIDTIGNANLGTATSAPCVGAGQAQRWSDRTTHSSAGSNTPGAGSTEPGPAGGGTVTMSWRLEGCSGSNNRQWAIGAVALQQGAVITLSKSVSPSGNQPLATDLAYTLGFTNGGDSAASSFVLTDPIPPNTDFKIGSVTSALGMTGLTVAVAYSNDGGTTFTYTPSSGGGGASSGYDRNVTNIRWTFTGNLSQNVPEQYWQRGLHLSYSVSATGVNFQRLDQTLKSVRSVLSFRVGAEDDQSNSKETIKVQIRATCSMKAGSL